VAVPREVQEDLAPVREGDESEGSSSGFLAALGIPPATPQTERRAYFLEGFSPKKLPPISAIADGPSRRFRKHPPQVMVLETPPRSVGGSVVDDDGASTRADPDSGHHDHGRLRLKDHNAPSSWPVARSPRVPPSPKLQMNVPRRPQSRSLPKQPELPKNKPAGFYVGGKPIFATK
jgi:hypothetical protein